MAKITGTYYELGPVEVTNEQLCEGRPEMSPERIFRQTGIRKRGVVPRGVLPSDWATATAKTFFRQNNIDPTSIDFVLYCGGAMDYRGPVTAAIIQHKLGLSKNCGAFDIPLGCSGFVYGLSTAHAYVETGIAKNVLLITQEIVSSVVHPGDVELRALFGDASACTLVTAGNGIGKFVLGTDGSGEKSLRVTRSALNNPIDREWFEANIATGDLVSMGIMEMNGMDVFNFTMERVPLLIKETLEKNNLQQNDISLFIFHQANGFMLETLRKKLGIEKEKFFTWIENAGNTVSATLPICLNEAQKQGLLQPGTKVLVAGFGIGFSWGGTVLSF